MWRCNIPLLVFCFYCCRNCQEYTRRMPRLLLPKPRTDEERSSQNPRYACVATFLSAMEFSFCINNYFVLCFFSCTVYIVHETELTLPHAILAGRGCSIARELFTLMFCVCMQTIYFYLTAHDYTFLCIF